EKGAAKQKGAKSLRPCNGLTGVASEELRRELLAAQPLVVTLDRSGELALALGGRLFVELPGPKLGEKSRFLDGALEAAERHFERLVVAKANTWHVANSLGLVS